MKKNRWWIFLVTTSGTSVVFLDNTVMPVALPTIQREWLLTHLSLIWIINSYLLSLTSLLLIGGRLSDLFGQRALFLIGLLLFGFGSAISGMSLNLSWMITGRVIQGAGGALIIPATSALLITNFPIGQRAKAIGINTGISSIFLILGPAIGGFFTQYLSWRGIFYLNLPLVGLGMIAALFILPRGRGKKEPFHCMGALMMFCGITAFILALMQGNEWGWTAPIVLGLLAISPLFVFFFWWISLHTPHPLIDFNLFKNSLFSLANLFIFLTQIIVMITILWAIYFQQELHFTPAHTGLMIFIAILPVFFMAPFGGYLADRFGSRYPLLIGYSLLSFALFWLLLTVNMGSILFMLPGLLAFGGGIPMTLSPAIAMALSQVNGDKLGIAAGITSETRQLAGTMGIAFLTAIYQITATKTGSSVCAFSTISLVAMLLSLSGLIIAYFTIHHELKRM
ncbi:MAG: MFS transporter [Chlamydiales bacterium]